MTLHQILRLSQLSQIHSPLPSMIHIKKKDSCETGEKQKVLTCQVPKLSLPSEMGSVREEPIKQAFTWAGWRRWKRKNISHLSSKCFDI